MGYRMMNRMTKLGYVTFGIALMVFSHLPGQVELLNQGAPVAVTSRVDSTEVTIGDVLHYTIEATYPDTVRVEAPEIGAQLGDFTVLGSSEPRYSQEGTHRTVQFQYRIAVYDTGHHVIPPVAIPYYDSDTLSTPKMVFAPDIPITVRSVLTADADSLRDIRPPMEPPRRWAWLWWLLGLLLAAGLGYYGWWRYKHRPRIVPRFRRIKIEPAHVIAFREIDRLLQSDLLARGEYKQFFSELSNILRRYLANRYFIPAPEETSEEILRSAIELELNDDDIHLLRSVLTLADQIKFARYIPNSSEVERAIEHTRQFIDRTRKEFESTEIVERIEDFPSPPKEEGVRE